MSAIQDALLEINKPHTEFDPDRTERLMMMALTEHNRLEAELTALREKCAELQRQLDEAAEHGEAAKQEPRHKSKPLGCTGLPVADDWVEYYESIGCPYGRSESLYAKPTNLPALIEQAKAEEREACAMVCEIGLEFQDGKSAGRAFTFPRLAAAIRARGETK